MINFSPEVVKEDENIGAPQSGSASTNFPRGIETGVNWCTKLMDYTWAHGYTRANATEEGQEHMRLDGARSVLRR